MQSIKLAGLVCLLFFISKHSIAQSEYKTDICIYGGTSAGVIAAYAAAKMGKTVLLIEPGNHLGGLSSGGLGYTDIGNKYAITGLALDFYRKIGSYYGKFEQWIFEPHIAEDIFNSYIKKAKVPVLYNYRVTGVGKNNSYIKEITVEHSDQPSPTSNKIIAAKMFIDCSYEGDLMAKAGVSYTVGREPNSLYNETYNGIQLRDKHQFPDGIDPYKIPGKPESGLLWGVSTEQLASQGTGDKKVQAYNFRICLTDKAENLIPITRPANYDSSKYELLLRFLEKKPAKDLWGFLKFDLMPNSKTDVNNNGPFSTDMIGENYDYPEADYASRKRIIQKHEDYVKGFLYFIGHDERMPAHLRMEMLKWGFPKDEYTDNGNWSPQIYVREARRMKGAYVMTQANCEGREVVSDAIAMAAYTMDSHNCQRIVINGMVKNEGDVQIGGFGPYPIAYRSIIPMENECRNILVPVCLSASHIAYGSIRMEPVFMALAQSSAVAAVLAIQSNAPVQHVSAKQIQSILRSNPLADNSTAEIVVDNDDKNNVQVKGNWAVVKNSGYGPSLLVSEKGDDEKAVQFTVPVKQSGRYKLYTYLLPKYPGLASEIHVSVFDGSKSKSVVVTPADIEVKGQTSGEWVYIGQFNFSTNKKSFIQISPQKGEGVALADAILLQPDSGK